MKLIKYLIFFEIGLIVFLLIRIIPQFGKKYKVSVIEKKNLIYKKAGLLKYFYEPEPNISITDSPYWLEAQATYTINNDSLNERFNYSVKKPKNVLRVVTLGNSYTYGLYSSTPDNWTELLENMLNTYAICGGNIKLEVINLGLPGYDLQYMYERYLQRGLKYNPDILILTLDDLKLTNEAVRPIAEEYEAKFLQDRQYYLKKGKNSYRTAASKQMP